MYSTSFKEQQQQLYQLQNTNFMKSTDNPGPIVHILLRSWT